MVIRFLSKHPLTCYMVLAFPDCFSRTLLGLIVSKTFLLVLRTFVYLLLGRNTLRTTERSYCELGARGQRGYPEGSFLGHNLTC